ncbi:MAG: tyrosine-type recombinase/integrase [Halieaceae bacterium]|jgi:integrase|nr:tyrosine-type recombinase/integrase [Halieaceae bacterium]
MLTALTVKALTPKPAKYEHMDADNPGFGVAVMPNGRKSFIYRYRVGGRTGTLRRMTLGSVDNTSLKDARAAYLNLKNQVGEGVDPLDAKAQARREEEQDLTFGALAQRYLSQYAAHKRTGAEDERILKHDVLPRWDKLKAKAIRKREVVALLDKIVERGASTQANRTFACVRKLFNWAAQKDLVESSPCAGVKAPSREKTKDRVLTDDEIRAFWNLSGLSPRMKAALRLQLLLGQRIGEVVGMRWDELDTTARLWTLPAERAKNMIVHTIPLTDTALEILEEQRLLRDGNDPYVFPAHAGKAEHLRTDSIGTALTRAIRAAGLAHFTAHDLRRTAATRISGAGTSREVLRKILNHVDRSVTARYDRYRYDNEKRVALECWAATLLNITGENL